MVPRNLCVRHRQGQQTTRRECPKCHRQNRTLRHGRAGGPRPAPHPGHAAERGGGQRCCCPRVRSFRTTSQTTSRAFPLDRHRPARGAGRTLNDHTCRPGHLHNVRIHSTVSTTRHQYDAPTPGTSCPCPSAPMRHGLTGATTERSQAAPPVARHQRRCRRTVRPARWPAPSPASARLRRGCSAPAPGPAASR